MLLPGCLIFAGAGEIIKFELTETFFMQKELQDILAELFREWSGESAGNMQSLDPRSGSARKYCRISGKKRSALGVFHEDRKETRAFLAFSDHFRKKGLPVPEIYARKPEKSVYLIQDLGDVTLHAKVADEKKISGFSENLTEIYKRVLSMLICFQTEGHAGLDYSLCTHRESFDSRSVMWDLNYFKYFGLRIHGISFDEDSLEDDFVRFARFIDRAEKEFFMYRDFQSRNIMLIHDDVYFIDYQGGRKGPLQYDVASLLYESKTDLPPALRQELQEHYLKELEKRTGTGRPDFMRYYYPLVWLRIMQVMGTYGLRGMVENKPLFMESIPYALNNIRWLLENKHIPSDVPEMVRCFEKLSARQDLMEYGKGYGQPMKIRITSFSYKHGMPGDYSGHGGGFVFDCRLLPNPGRLEEYKSFTGMDEKVIRYMSSKPEVSEFLNHVFGIIDQSVKKYQARQFEHLSVFFGCTGGQHRSVYCAEKLAQYIKSVYRLESVIFHRELEK